MKGYRTLILNGGVAALVGVLHFIVGADLTQFVSGEHAIAIVTAANFVLRFFTNTPVGQDASVAQSK